MIVKILDTMLMMELLLLSLEIIESVDILIMLVWNKSKSFDHGMYSSY